MPEDSVIWKMGGMALWILVGGSCLLQWIHAGDGVTVGETPFFLGMSRKELLEKVPAGYEVKQSGSDAVILAEKKEGKNIARVTFQLKEGKVAAMTRDWGKLSTPHEFGRALFASLGGATEKGPQKATLVNGVAQSAEWGEVKTITLSSGNRTVTIMVGDESKGVNVNIAESVRAETGGVR